MRWEGIQDGCMSGRTGQAGVTSYPKQILRASGIDDLCSVEEKG